MESDSHMRILREIGHLLNRTQREVTSDVVFLASNEASYITGVILDVDGGGYLRQGKRPESLTDG